MLKLKTYTKVANFGPVYIKEIKNKLAELNICKEDCSMEEEQQESFKIADMVISFDNIPLSIYLEGETYYSSFIVNKKFFNDILSGETLEINGKNWELT